jgi:hypothetical protein
MTWPKPVLSAMAVASITPRAKPDNSSKALSDCPVFNRIFDPGAIINLTRIDKTEAKIKKLVRVLDVTFQEDSFLSTRRKLRLHYGVSPNTE